MTEKTEDLIAEMRERAERPSTGSNTAQCMREAADALAVLSAPQEAKSIAKVVPVSYEASASCSHGVCPTGCSHLMWACSACSCEGGWGASRERLEELAAEHVCPPTPQEGDAREYLIAVLNAIPGHVWGAASEVGALGGMADALLAAFPVLSRDIAGEIDAEREDTDLDALGADAYINGLIRAAEIVRNGR